MTGLVVPKAQPLWLINDIFQSRKSSDIPKVTLISWYKNDTTAHELDVMAYSSKEKMLFVVNFEGKQTCYYLHWMVGGDCQPAFFKLSLNSSDPPWVREYFDLQNINPERIRKKRAIPNTVIRNVFENKTGEESKHCDILPVVAKSRNYATLSGIQKAQSELYLAVQFFCGHDWFAFSVITWDPEKRTLIAARNVMIDEGIRDQEMQRLFRDYPRLAEYLPGCRGIRPFL